MLTRSNHKWIWMWVGWIKGTRLSVATEHENSGCHLRFKSSEAANCCTYTFLKELLQPTTRNESAEVEHLIWSYTDLLMVEGTCPTEPLHEKRHQQWKLIAALSGPCFQMLCPLNTKHVNYFIPPGWIVCNLSHRTAKIFLCSFSAYFPVPPVLYFHPPSPCCLHPINTCWQLPSAP